MQTRRIGKNLPQQFQPLACKNLRESTPQTDRAPGGLKLMPMKRRSLPIWLLRDVPAFLGVMISFWPLMILVIRNGFAAMRGKKISKSVFDQLPIFLAHAESRLDFALWREAYRRLGWNPRLIPFELFAAPEDRADTARRFENYRRACMSLEACARGYVEHLRAQHGLSKAELVAHGSTDARLRRAAHHELTGVAASPFALILSSARSARPSKDERGHAHARGPPLPLSQNPTQPTSQASPARSHPHAQTRIDIAQAPCRSMLVDLSVPEEGSAMTYRNIVVHIDETAAARTRASIAAGLAVKFGATLTGMFMRSDYVPAFIAGDAFSAVTAVEAYVEQRDRTIAKSSAAARAAFEAETSPHKISTDWVEVNGDDDDNVLAAVRRYDLTVFPHVATSSLNTYAVSAAHIGMGSGAPVLVLPERGFQIPFGKRVLVAWKETREAARALRDAWPFLMAADEVHFLAVSRNAPDGFDDAMRRNLEAHGCTNIHMHVDRNDDIDVANAIQRHSGRVGADLVVLGLYGHSRMREMLLGGVSRDMLDALHLPLLVSH